MNSSRTSKKSLSREDVLSFFRMIAGNEVIIIPHEITDHDAYAASMLLKTILEKHFVNKYKVTLLVSSISNELKEFLERIGIQYGTEIDLDLPSFNDYTVILVDITAPQRFTNPKIVEIINNAKRILAIDHHIAENENVHTLFLSRTSTTEVVLEIAHVLDLLNELLKDKLLVNLSIAAILTDTSMLYYADEYTFQTLSLLVPRGEYKVVYTILKGAKKGVSERMARLKGVKRALILKVDDKIIAVTKVGSYEGSVASALISLGANIAIVVSEKREKGKKYYRISGRSSGFDLSKIFLQLNKYEGFVGGGHRTAAGLIVDADKVKDASQLIKMIIDKLLEELSEK